jgi:hypothetical protein
MVIEPVFVLLRKMAPEELHRRTLLYHDPQRASERQSPAVLGCMIIHRQGALAGIEVVDLSRRAGRSVRFLAEDEIQRLSRAPSGYAFDYFLE